MDTSKLPIDIYDLVSDVWLMQVATASDNQPWIANVFFVADKKLNFYWLSTPNRRHSRELEQNNRAAIAVAIKTDKPVIGVQAEGKVGIEHDLNVIGGIMPRYIKKYGSGKDFLKLKKQDISEHQLFKFTPDILQLFDEVNYKPKDNPIRLFFD